MGLTLPATLGSSPRASKLANDSLVPPWSDIDCSDLITLPPSFVSCVPDNSRTRHSIKILHVKKTNSFCRIFTNAILLRPCSGDVSLLAFALYVNYRALVKSPVISIRQYFKVRPFKLWPLQVARSIIFFLSVLQNLIFERYLH